MDADWTRQEARKAADAKLEAAAALVAEAAEILEANNYGPAAMDAREAIVYINGGRES